MLEVHNIPTMFMDNRGVYMETWNTVSRPAINWVQDCTSVSCRNVLRGVHGDRRGCWKLVTCLFGYIWVVVVDPITKKWQGHCLHYFGGEQILVPPDCGLGHVVLSEKAVFHYKQSQLYDRNSQFTIKWDDADYGIEWPIDNPILSERDRVGPFNHQPE